MSDPIADLLTRIRNALMAEHHHVDVRWSRIKEEIVKLMKNEGFVKEYLVQEKGTTKTLRVVLKYGPARVPVIRGLKRVSKPSVRRYVGHSHIPNVLGGLGLAIMTTPKGIMTGKEAKEQRVGGEVLCHVW